jgi:endonuclease/exonuclease/phosphatase family metal-dependent hydrolase
MPSPVTLKIISYNIHKGFTAGNRKFVLSRIKESIRRVGADLVLLQEVQGHHEEKAKVIQDWPSESQFEFLSDEVWAHYAYGKNAVYASGHHGNAILSKFPIKEWSNIDISTNHFEERGALHAVVDIEPLGRSLHCLCLHLSLFQRGRKKQLLQVVERIQAEVPEHEPVVIGGDFNDWRRKASDLIAHDLKVEEVFCKLTGKYAKTFPAKYPLFPLDRVYVRGVAVKRAEVLKSESWPSLSDHLPVYVEIEIG